MCRPRGSDRYEAAPQRGRRIPTGGASGHKRDTAWQAVFGQIIPK
jgi:hypothetical protein